MTSGQPVVQLMRNLADKTKCNFADIGPPHTNFLFQGVARMRWHMDTNDTGHTQKKIRGDLLGGAKTVALGAGVRQVRPSFNTKKIARPNALQ